MSEYGLRNFLGRCGRVERVAQRVKGLQMKKKSGGGRQEGIEDRKVKQGDGGTIQYAPGAPT